MRSYAWQLCASGTCTVRCVFWTSLTSYCAKMMQRTHVPFSNMLYLMSCFQNASELKFPISGVPMPHAIPKDFSNHVEIHLIAWQHLAAICQDQSLRLFKLRPKHHSCDHMGTQVARTKVNPRKAMQCFGDESFLGFWKRIGVKCHSTSILRRIYQRYLLFLSLRWRDAKAGSWLGVCGKCHVACSHFQFLCLSAALF